MKNNQQIRDLARDIVIALAGLTALAAASVFVRPTPAGAGQSPQQLPRSTPATRKIADTTPLPADYLDICRAAGL